MGRGSYFRGESDVVLIAGGQRFQLHRKVLASSSPVFKRMLRPDAEGNVRSELAIDGVDAARMGLVLDYLYSGTLRLCCPDTALTMLSPAQKFLLEGLTDEIERYLWHVVPPEHFLEMYRYADVRGLAHLRAEFMDRVADDLPRFARGPAYERLEIRLVELLVKHAAEQTALVKGPHERAEFELEVVEAITRWLLAATPSSKRSKSRGPNASFDRTRSFGSASFERASSRGRGASYDRAMDHGPGASFDGARRGANASFDAGMCGPNSSFDAGMRGPHASFEVGMRGPNASFDGARGRGPGGSFDMNGANMSGDREMGNWDEHSEPWASNRGMGVGTKPWGSDPGHAGNKPWGAGRRGRGGEAWFAEEDEGDEVSTEGSHQDMRVRDGATPYSSGRKWAPMGMLKAPWRGGSSRGDEDEHSEDESDEGYGPGYGERDRDMRRGGSWFDRSGRDEPSHGSDDGYGGAHEKRRYDGTRGAPWSGGGGRERLMHGGDFDDDSEDGYGGTSGYGGRRYAQRGGGRGREGGNEDGYGRSRSAAGAMNGFGAMRNSSRGRYGEDAASEDVYDGRRGGGSLRSPGSGRGRYGEDGASEEAYDWRRGGARSFSGGRGRYGEDAASEEEGRFGRWARRRRDPQEDSDSEDSEELHERREKNAEATSSEDADADSGEETDEDFTVRGEGGRWKSGSGSKCRRCLLGGKHLVRQGHLLSEQLVDEDRVHYEERLFRVVDLRYLEGAALRRVAHVAESKDLGFLAQLVESELQRRARGSR